MQYAPHFLFSMCYPKAQGRGLDSTPFLSFHQRPSVTSFSSNLVYQKKKKNSGHQVEFRFTWDAIFDAKALRNINLRCANLHLNKDDL